MEELREVIVPLLLRPEFNPAEINDDQHKRISCTLAVHKKMIKLFDMRESHLDGNQYLTMFMREDRML